MNLSISPESFEKCHHCTLLNAQLMHLIVVVLLPSSRNFFMKTSSTTFTQCSPEATEFGEITQNKGH